MANRIVGVMVAAIAGAVWWMLCGLAAFGVLWSSTRWAALITLIVNQTVPFSAWQQPSPWNFLLPALGSLLFGGLLAVGFSWLVTRRGWEGSTRVFRVLGGWVVAVLAAGMTAAIWTMGEIISQPVWLGFQSAFRDALPDLLSSALFGIVWGWLPALVLSGVREASITVEAVDGPDARGNVSAVRAHPNRGRGSLAGVFALAIAVAVVLGAGTGVVAAQPAAARAGRIAAGGSPNGVPRYTPPPTPTPVPPPDVAATPTARAAGACEPEDTSLTVSGIDGALGHRATTLVLVNTGTTSCTVDGYPDVAFATQSGAGLAVPVTHGSSYTATDPGPTLVTLPPGASAQAHLGWGSTGATTGTAGILWAAAYAGEQRTRLAINSDITLASPVTVTAWATPSG